MAGEEHVYTVVEASELLPELEVRLPRIKQARRVVIEGGRRIEAAVAEDGGGSEGSAYYASLRSLRAELEWFADRSILLRDPETGVVDFPGEVDGTPGFLCWRLGEPRIEHWHPPDTGFAGRRTL